MSLGVAASTPTVVVAASIATLLVAWQAWLELRRSTPRRAGRLLATFFAAVALLALVARPTVRWADGVEEAVLITPGASAEQIAAAIDGSLPVVALASAEGGLSGSAEVVADTAALRRRHPELRELRVVGGGLRAWDLDELAARVTGFEPTAEPEAGVAEVDWRRRLVLGEELVVRGRSLFDVDSSGATGRIQLLGPAGVEDEAALDADGRWILRARPKATGRLRYRLALHEDAEGEEHGETAEAIDVVVVEPEPLTVLWLEGSPSFETRRFRTWLSERGGATAVRSQVSRGRFREEHHGLLPGGLGRLDGELLERFDLLVVDGRTAGGWTGAERRAVAEAVDAGLGLLLRDPDRRALDALPFDVDIEEIDGVDELTVELVWPGAEPLVALALEPLRLSVEAGAMPGVEPLAVDRAGRLFGTVRPFGAGRLAVSAVDGTQRWLLTGEDHAYSRFWSRMVTSTARPVGDVDRWQMPAGPVLVDEPRTLTLTTVTAAPRATLQTAGEKPEVLALRQDELDPTRYTATVWPRAAGWHRVASESAELAFDAQPASAWRAWHAAESRRATALAVEQRPARPPAAVATVASRELSRGWAYAVLFVALAYLWIDQRWRG